VFAAGSSELDVALADQILDWSAAYRTGVSVSGGYGEIAPAPPPMGPYGYSYVETNGDLVADLGVLLAGATLNDIDATNFVSPGGAAPPATAGLHLNLSASAWN